MNFAKCWIWIISQKQIRSKNRFWIQTCKKKARILRRFDYTIRNNKIRCCVLCVWLFNATISEIEFFAKCRHKILTHQFLINHVNDTIRKLAFSNNWLIIFDFSLFDFRTSMFCNCFFLNNQLLYNSEMKSTTFTIFQNCYR